MVENENIEVQFIPESKVYLKNKNGKLLLFILLGALLLV
jgi:hypothetical protein